MYAEWEIEREESEAISMVLHLTNGWRFKYTLLHRSNIASLRECSESNEAYGVLWIECYCFMIKASKHPNEWKNNINNDSNKHLLHSSTTDKGLSHFHDHIFIHISMNIYQSGIVKCAGDWIDMWIWKVVVVITSKRNTNWL